MGRVLDTTLCDQVRPLLAAGQWFSPGTPASSTNKTDSDDITEILLKVALNTINLNQNLNMKRKFLLQNSNWMTIYTLDSIY